MRSLREQLRESGPLFALGEPDSAPIFLEAGKKPGYSCGLQKFFGARDRGSDIWSGFSPSLSLQLSRFEPTLDLEATSLQMPETDPGDYPSWKKSCAGISAAIRAGKIRKAVPARYRSYSISGAERAALAELALAKLFSAAPSRTHRFVVREKEDIFFGATPELLFRREKNEIFVPAIAGTRALADGSEATLASDLMSSEKEREEHALVVEGIHGSLRSLGLKPLSSAEPDILRVPGLLHLYTPVRARDPGNISSEQLISALHPTPAVGGFPKKEAVNFLLENEPWNRGLFASPILFRLPEKELCLVAIRSALLTSNRLYVFAGAGFVKGSDPEREWKETDRKMDVMQDLLFGGSLGKR
jgi:isochorismate synthase